MSALFLYDDAAARLFEPFALTRPVGEMRAGALLVRDRWTRVLRQPVDGHLTSAHLAGFDEPQAPPVHQATVPAGSWIVNARFAPSLTAEPELSRRHCLANGQSVAVRTTRDISADELRDGRLPLAELASDEGSACELPGYWMHEVWDYIRHLVPMLLHDIPVLGARLGRGLPASAVGVGTHPVFIDATADVEPSVCFDTSAGPILIAAGAHVQAFTRLVGPLYVGVGTTLMADRIAASSIGETCKVHGEVSNAIFTGYANKGHDGFVGHSILGRWVNLGAGTITSNLKNTYGTVQLWTPQGIRETGMQFLGTLFGDHAKTGIGLRLTTGSVLGAGCNVYGTVMPPKAVAPFTWGEAGAFTVYRADKFLDVAERVMARRDIVLSPSARAQLAAAHTSRWLLDE